MVKGIWSTQMQNFKVGDWVILNEDKQTLAKVLEIDNEYIFKCKLHFINEKSIAWCSEMSYYKHWQPTEGEWCWFFNDTTDVPTLAKLIEIVSLFGRGKTYNVKTPSCISETSYSYSRTMSFKYCEPFIGQLPSNLKDNT